MMLVCRFRSRVYPRSLSVVMLVCVDLVLGCNAESLFVVMLVCVDLVLGCYADDCLL